MTKEEALDLLKSNVARFNELRQNNQERLDLSGVDLSRTNLKGADLRRIDFTGATFQEANLSEAQFGGDILRDADFRGADLTEANFHHAMMQGADIRGADFSPNTRMGRICVNLASFEKVRWDKPVLEEILAILNTNQDWLIQYEIIPKATSP